MTNSVIIKHNKDTIKFMKSNRPDKKYTAIITYGTKHPGINKGDQRIVHFGGIKKNGEPYSQYFDGTGLGIYSGYNHLDMERRNRYYARHGTNPPLYTPMWFSHNFLW